MSSGKPVRSAERDCVCLRKKKKKRDRISEKCHPGEEELNSHGNVKGLGGKRQSMKPVNTAMGRSCGAEQCLES